MIDQQKFIQLKTKYSVSDEDKNNLSDSSFLYFILAKADLDIDLLNDADWNWLGDNNFIETCDLLISKKEEKEKGITNIAHKSFNSIYNKYSFLFRFTPNELFKFKHNFNLKYAIQAIASS